MANATTLSSGGGPVMHVQDISVVSESVGGGGNRFRGVATITIYDATGSAVSGATVDGSFTGPSSSNESGTTDAAGEVSFNSRTIRNPGSEWCFEVTDVVLAGATYDPAANVVTLACESGPVAMGVETQGSESDPVAEVEIQTSESESSSTAKAMQRAYKTDLKVYPNPFRNSTRVAFQLPERSHVILEVYSVHGKRIAVITDRSYEAGQHSLEWNTMDLGSGMYFLQLKTGKQLVDTRKLMLIR